MAAMDARYLDGIILEAHSSHPPSEAEWAEFLGLCAAQLSTVRGCLVVTDGGSPSAQQRGALMKLIKGRTLPTAVVTPSLLSRGAVTALSWLGHAIRAFAPNELNAALDFVRVTDRRAALLLLAELRAGVLEVALPANTRELSTEELETLMASGAAVFLGRLRACAA
jgi:hypothetical protein